MRKYIIIILLLIALPCWGADQVLYVRDGATGTTCSDWASGNACDQISTAVALIDRATYDDVYIYVADGSYGAISITSPTDGTDRIYIKKATASAHGSETGWDNAYGDGQATIQAAAGTSGSEIKTIYIGTSYVTIDGVAGTGETGSSYGFVVKLGADIGVIDPDGHYYVALALGGTGLNDVWATNVTIQYIFFDGPTELLTCLTKPKASGGCTNDGVLVDTAYANYFEASHIYSEGFTNNINVRRTENALVHDSYFGNNTTSATGNHGQNMNVELMKNIKIYNNLFRDSQTFVIAVHNNIGTKAATTGLEVYNNIAIGSGSYVAIFLGGMASSTDVFWGAKIHHNTVINSNLTARGFVYLYGLTDSTTNRSYAYNNLFYNTAYPQISIATAYPADAGENIVHDNNAYLYCTGATTTGDETSPQVDAEAPSTIFTNYAGGVYTINASDQTAIDRIIGQGKTLASPFDIDRAGVSRTAPFDIGAYDVGGEADTTSPTLAEVTPVPASSSNQAPQYVFSSDEAGTITYGGTCGNGSLSTAVVGNNSTSWNLPVGTYSDCTVTVTDAASNASTPLAVTEFVITPAISSASKVIESGVTFMRLP
jgi:hypothetical protein